MIMRRKIFAIFMSMSIISSLCAPFVFSLNVREVRAAVPTFETNPAVTGQLLVEEGQLAQTLLEYAEEFILETLKKRLLDMMVDQIIQWIQGGGEPKFVTDWKGFLEDASNAAVGDFAQEIGLGFLCDPFHFQIQIGLLPVPRFSDQVTCTLDEIVGNIENFYTDFSNGGWIAYTASLEPQNNYFGAMLMSNIELEERKASAQLAQQNEALAGGGFLSTKKCDAFGQNCVITTPGNVIGDLTAKAIGTDIDYILSAEQLSDYVAAIANAAINRLIIEGVEGIQGLSTSNAPSGGSVGGAGGSCAGLRGAVLTACLNAVQNADGNFATAKSNLRKQINQSIPPREEADGFYTDIITRLTVYKNDLNNIASQLFTKSCVAVAQYRSEVQLELDFASTTLANMIDGKTRNQGNIVELIAFRDRVNAIPNKDWAALSKLMNEINASNANNPSASLDLRNQLEIRLENLKTRISDNIQLFNQYISTC